MEWGGKKVVHAEPEGQILEKWILLLIQKSFKSYGNYHKWLPPGSRWDEQNTLKIVLPCQYCHAFISEYKKAQSTHSSRGLRHQTRMQVRVWEQKYETVITVTLCYKPAESLKPILSFQQAPAILLLPQHNWAPCGSKLHSWKDPVEQSSSEQNPGICQRSKHTNSFSLQIRKKTSSTHHFFRSVQKLESVHYRIKCESIITTPGKVQTQFLSHIEAKPRRPSCLLILGNRGLPHLSPAGGKLTARLTRQGT